MNEVRLFKVCDPFCSHFCTKFSNFNCLKTTDLMNNRDRPFGKHTKGNLMQSIIIYCFIAFDRKEYFVANKPRLL